MAQSAYLSPVATVAAVQMQQLAALNPSSIIATPIASITPSSGNERQRRLPRAGVIRFLLQVWEQINQESLRGQKKTNTNMFWITFLDVSCHTCPFQTRV